MSTVTADFGRQGSLRLGHWLDPPSPEPVLWYRFHEDDMLRS
jgi:hypothetical protein